MRFNRNSIGCLTIISPRPPDEMAQYPIPIPFLYMQGGRGKKPLFLRLQPFHLQKQASTSCWSAYKKLQDNFAEDVAAAVTAVDFFRGLTINKKPAQSMKPPRVNGLFFA